MSIEVEVKYRVHDRGALERQLAARRVPTESAIDQRDVYFAHPARDFAATREAFRLRCVGSENWLTYKGPKWEGPAKTREEIEVEFAPGPDGRERMERLLERLGFRPVAEVRKTRTTYRFSHRDCAIVVTLDRAEGLGDFAEVEAIAAGEAEVPAAQAAVLDLAATLGLTEAEPRSYLRMILEQRGAS